MTAVVCNQGAQKKQIWKKTDMKASCKGAALSIHYLFPFAVAFMEFDLFHCSRPCSELPALLLLKSIKNLQTAQSADLLSFFWVIPTSFSFLKYNPLRKYPPSFMALSTLAFDGSFLH